MKSILFKGAPGSILLVVALFLPLCAQNAVSPIVSISSKPSGVTVILTGDQTVAGITPTTFSQKLMGFYRITAHREGYETYRSSVILSGHEATSIDIKLSPKTRIKAGTRSLLIPGWGQVYNGWKTKAVFVTISAAAAGITAGLLHLRYVHARNDYDDVHDRFNGTRSVVERERMLSELYTVQKKAYNAERDRKIGLGVLAGVWAYGILDAMIFFPDYSVSISGASLSVIPEVDIHGAKIVGRVKF